MTRRIGITGRLRDINGQRHAGVNAAYVSAVAAAGGLPLVLPPAVPASSAGQLAEALDGLLISGGADIDPVRYGATPHPKLGPLEPDRDAFEFAMLDAARARGLPVLAICRGMQVVNVALGGTLWQDLPTERPGGVHHDGTWARTARVHAIEVVAGSALARSVGAGPVTVNSFHHQGVRRLAPGLAPTATAPDGLIEGFESADGPWLVGVQWHPEAFHAETDSPDSRLFQAFVRACTPRPAGAAA